MYSVKDTTNVVGFPIRKSADQCLLAANRSLTQPITSFIAFIRQGIHQMLLLNAWIEITRSDKTAFLLVVTQTKARFRRLQMISAAQIEFLVIRYIISVLYWWQNLFTIYKNPGVICFWQKIPIIYAPFPVHKLLKLTVFIQVNLRS